MDQHRCANCGTQVRTCPGCKQKLDNKKPLYSPEAHLMKQVTKPTTRGSITPLPPKR